MGLIYEQQRPDAHDFVSFECSAVEGYAEATKRVGSIEAGEPAFPPEMPVDERMRLVSVSMLHYHMIALLLTLIHSCTRSELARKYLRAADRFIPLSVNNDLFETSRVFDYQSLMTSDSFTNKDPGQELYPLLSLHGEPMLLSGGNADPKLAGPSPLDIERVAALYPSEFHATDLGQTPAPPPGKRSVAADNTRSLRSCSRVEIPGVAATTAGPVTTQTPISAKSS